MISPWSKAQRSGEVRFTSYALPVRPLVLIQAELKREDRMYRGSGVSLFARNAKAAAFGEAVERAAADAVLASSSNGFAAHVDAALAEERARLELLERAVLLQTWGQEGIWKLQQSSLTEFLNQILRLQDQVFEFRSYTVSVEGGVLVVFSVFDDPRGGFLFDGTAVSSTQKLGNAIVKNFMSLSKMIRAYEAGRAEPRGETLPLQSPGDHLRFYSRPENKMALLHQTKFPGTGRVSLRDGEHTRTVEVRSPIPGIRVFRSLNESWPDLTWGPAPAGKVFPHPLA